MYHLYSPERSFFPYRMNIRGNSNDALFAFEAEARIQQGVLFRLMLIRALDFPEKVPNTPGKKVNPIDDIGPGLLTSSDLTISTI